MANEISIIVRSQDAASRGINAVSSAADGMGSAIDNASGALTAVDGLMNASRNKATKLARAQLDVDQAMQDAEQAANDLEQAHIDLNQSEIDGAQAGVDVKQAQIDAKQAMLDAETAQKDYNKAVKEFGPNSAEAKQASIDLDQANSDLEQANVDATQATSDLDQATQDGQQAMDDMSQAVIDGKGAQLDLNDAQRELDPSNLQDLANKMAEFAPLVTAAIGVTQVFTTAQLALNGAFLANPIGLTIVAIGLLVLALVTLWKKSQTAREIMSSAFAGTVSAVLDGVQVILKAYQGLANGVLKVVETVLRALGKIPGNDWADRAADNVKDFRDDANRFFDGAIKKTEDWKRAANNLPKKIKLEGNIADLSKKIDQAKNRLKEKGLTDPQRTKIKGDIAQLQERIRRAKAALATLQGKTITVTTRFVTKGNRTAPSEFMAHGGISGAANGGGRSGLTWTGEAGPELLKLPPGTQVRSNPDSRRTASYAAGGGRGGEQVIRIEIEGTGLLAGLRKQVRVEGGNVQQVLGVGGR